KTGAWFGRDIVFLLLAIIAAFFVASLGWYAIFSAAVLLLLHLVALCFNQVVFRGKTVLTCCALLPLDLGFTFVKLLSVCGNHLTYSVRRIHGGSSG
ncbi:MAG: hypothetical protein P1U77_20910, partial [Rubripirellula sp.]|nr:hypothetical protein [Rubripirellula sp.]